MSEVNWHGKPYYSLDAYLKNRYGHKCYKVALNAHMTCPNRDGTLDTRGCVFCSKGGSGEFAVDIDNSDIKYNTGAGCHTETLTGGTALASLEVQLQEGVGLIRRKLGANANDILPNTVHNVYEQFNPLAGPCIIAYFQAYTNTYAPVSYLRQIFSLALSHPLVCGISIATRPDCLPPEVLALLDELRTEFPDKFLWVELGLQTIHEKTARFIRRGYELSCFEKAVGELNRLDLPVIVHVILGLPDETRLQMLETVEYLNKVGIFGVKLQLLHVLESTDLAETYRKGTFSVLTKEAYLDILIDCLVHLSPEIVVHRVTGDGPKRILIAPQWSGNKRDVLNSLHQLMYKENARQGRLYLQKMGTRCPTGSKSQTAIN